jgi:tetratricopeptide (TPR) repeat protein
MLKTHLIRQINLRLLVAFISTTCVTLQMEGQSCLPLSIQSRLAEYKRENRFDEALILLNLYEDSLTYGNNKKAAFESEMLKADLYRIKGQYQKSAELIDSLRLSDFAAGLKKDVLIGQLYTIQGTLFLTRGELKKGLTGILKAIEIFYSSVGKQDTLLGPCFNKLGNYYYFSKNYDSALYWYSKAMEMAGKKRNNMEDRASYAQNMGIIYLELNEYDKAEKCFLESLRLKEALFSPNSFSLGRLYLNLGRFYQGVSALDKAFYFIEKAENIYSISEGNSYIELAKILWNKGLIYHLSGESELGLTYLFSAKRIIDSVFVENKNLLASLNSYIGL